MEKVERRRKAKAEEQLLPGEYYFSPCSSVSTPAGWIGRWNGRSRTSLCFSAPGLLSNGRDALVLKAMSLVLGEHLQDKISPHCYHMAGNGGAKAAVTEVSEQCASHRFVLRSDVNSYYASIDHTLLLKQLAAMIDDQAVLELIGHMLQRLDDVDGELFTVEKGITKGCPLSPLLGAMAFT